MFYVDKDEPKKNIAPKLILHCNEANYIVVTNYYNVITYANLAMTQ